MKSIGKKVIREEVYFIPQHLYKKLYFSHAYRYDCHDDDLEPKIIRCAASAGS